MTEREKRDIKKINARKRMREWRKKNPEKNKAYKKKSYENNKDKYRAWGRKWAQENRELVNYLSKKRRAKDPEFSRRVTVKKYGLTKEIFDKMLLDQGNSCKICHKIFVENKKAHIDHEHKTGNVRGLLCTNCNSGLGMFKDSVEILSLAILYLNNGGKYNAVCEEKL